MIARGLVTLLFAVTAISAACSGPTSGESKRGDDDSRSSAAGTTSAETSGSGASRSAAAAPSSASVALTEPGPATEIPDDATPTPSESASASASTSASGKPPTGSASISGLSSSGGTIANAPAVVAGMAAGFRRCYNRALQENPNVAGSMKVRAKIGPNGEVLAAEPTEVKGLPGTLTSCVAARVSSAQFAPPTGGSATVVIPVALSSN